MFTTDTRKTHCPIRICYAGTGVGPYHANELTDTIYLPRDRPIAVIRATEHSDYSGGSVEASNYRAMLANEDMNPHLVQIYGSHGYQALAYDATLGPVPGSWSISNALDGFENHYPIFDDDDHSELEHELESEAWDDHGRLDFRKALVSVLDKLDENYGHEIPDDDDAYTLRVVIDSRVCSDPETWGGALWDLWCSGCDSLNVNGGSGFVVETGSVVHFHIAEWQDKAGRDKGYPTNRPIHDTLRELAKETRVVDEDGVVLGGHTPAP